MVGPVAPWGSKRCNSGSCMRYIILLDLPFRDSSIHVKTNELASPLPFFSQYLLEWPMDPAVWCSNCYNQPGSSFSGEFDSRHLA